MLSGSTRKSVAKPAVKNLTAHLLKDVEAGKEQRVTLLEARGVTGRTLAAQLFQLAARASDLPSAKPVLHLHIDPAMGDSEEAREEFKRRFEETFDLTDAARVSVRHELLSSAGWREKHDHVVYELRNSKGKLASLSNDYLTRSRIAVEVARDHNLACPPVKHPEKVEKWLRANGRTETANWLFETYPRLPDPPGAKPTRYGPNRIAAETPEERQQAERTQIRKADVGAAAWAALQSGDNGAARAAALRDQGLSLHRGEAAVVVRDEAGGVSPLLRAINTHLRATSQPTIRKGDLDKLLAGAAIPDLEPAGARPAPPARKPKATPAPAPAPAVEAEAFDFPTIEQIDQAEAARLLAQTQARPPEPVARQPAAQPAHTVGAVEANELRADLNPVGAHGNPMLVERPPAPGTDFSAPIREAVRLLHPGAVGHRPQPAAAPARHAPAQPQPARPQQPRPQAARAKDDGRKDSTGKGQSGAATAAAGQQAPRPRRPVAQPQPVQSAPEPQPRGWLARLTDWMKAQKQPKPAQTARPQPKATPAALPADNNAGLDPRALYDARAEQVLEYGHGRAPRPTWERAERTKEPASRIPADASILLMKKPVAPGEEDYLLRRWTRTLRNAGRDAPKEAAADLVALRRGTAPRAYTAATATNFADPLARAEQLRRLHERAKEIKAEVRATEAMPTAVKSVDQLWLEHCRRHHADKIGKTESDLDRAHQFRADAERHGDRRGVERWDSALSILANERHRFLLSLRATHDAEWRTIHEDAAEAPKLLAELRARRLAALEAEQRRLAEALRESENERRREPLGPNAMGPAPQPDHTPGSPYRPR